MDITKKYVFLKYLGETQDITNLIGYSNIKTIYKLNSGNWETWKFDVNPLFNGFAQLTKYDSYFIISKDENPNYTLYENPDTTPVETVTENPQIVLAQCNVNIADHSDKIYKIYGVNGSGVGWLNWERSVNPAFNSLNSLNSGESYLIYSDNLNYSLCVFAKPYNVYSEDGSDSSIILNWNYPTDYLPTGYTIQYKYGYDENGNMFWWSDWTNAFNVDLENGQTISTLNVPNLENGTNYQFRIATSKNNIITGEWSDPYDTITGLSTLIKPTSDTIPPPQNLRCSVTHSSITFVFDHLPGVESNVLYSAQIFLYDENFNDTMTKTLEDGFVWTVFSNLPSDTLFALRVRALVNDSSNWIPGEWSSFVLARTDRYESEPTSTPLPNTPTPFPEPSPTSFPTNTPTNTPTSSPTPTTDSFPTSTPYPTPTQPPLPPPTQEPTHTPFATGTPTPNPTSTLNPTSTPSPTSTLSIEPTSTIGTNFSKNL